MGILPGEKENLIIIKLYIGINKWRILFEYFLCIKSGFPVGAGRNTNNIVRKYEPHVYYITIILSYFQFFLKH